jgi:tetratricopeptide (TPR) repeat protein
VIQSGAPANRFAAAVSFHARRRCFTQRLHYLRFVHRLPLLLFSALVLAAGFSGCATTPPRPAVPYTGDPVVDGNANLAVAPERDKALWDYRIGAAAIRRGQYDEAAAKLDDGLARAAAAMGPNAEAAQSRKLFGREETKPFVGEAYERIMANYYRGLVYWHAGEPDNARALFRTGQFIDSDTEDKTYAGDWVLLDYLDGLVTRKLAGDGSDALARARASAKAQGRIAPPDYDPEANVLVFCDYGPAPVKYASGEYGELLKIMVDDSPVASARLTVDGREIALPPYDDVGWQATTRGGRVMDHILGNKAVFKKSTDTIGDVAILGAAGTSAFGTSKDSSNVALGLLAVGLISKVTSAATQTEADTRSWNNLPRYLSFAALRLKPGDYPAELTFFKADGRELKNRTQTFTIHVPAPGTGSTAEQPADIVIVRSDVAY